LYSDKVSSWCVSHGSHRRFPFVRVISRNGNSPFVLTRYMKCPPVGLFPVSARVGRFCLLPLVFSASLLLLVLSSHVSSGRSFLFQFCHFLPNVLPAIFPSRLTGIFFGVSQSWCLGLFFFAFFFAFLPFWDIPVSLVCFFMAPLSNQPSWF